MPPPASVASSPVTIIGDPPSGDAQVRTPQTLQRANERRSVPFLHPIPIDEFLVIRAQRINHRFPLPNFWARHSARSARTSKVLADHSKTIVFSPSMSSPLRCVAA
jgi:hypothetical protein